MNRAELGSTYCKVHNGGSNMAKVEDLRLYHLTDARNRQRLAELSEQDPLSALNELIAIARRLVERRVNITEQDADLLLAFRDLLTLQLTVARLVTSAHKIEQNLDTLLGKPDLIRYGQHIIQIVIDELKGIVNYGEVVQRIAGQTIEAITVANNHATPALVNVPSLVGRIKREAGTFLIESIEDQLRIAEMVKHERLKSLNEDIALQIILIERRWNMVKSDMDLIAASAPLCLAMKTLEKQIKAAHEIEQKMGNLLTVESIQRLGQAVSQIIADELSLADVPEHEKLTDRIVEKIISTPYDRSRRRLAA